MNIYEKCSFLFHLHSIKCFSHCFLWNFSEYVCELKENNNIKIHIFWNHFSSSRFFFLLSQTDVGFTAGMTYIFQVVVCDRWMSETYECAYVFLSSYVRKHMMNHIRTHVFLRSYAYIDLRIFLSTQRICFISLSLHLIYAYIPSFSL